MRKILARGAWKYYPLAHKLYQQQENRQLRLLAASNNSISSGNWQTRKKWLLCLLILSNTLTAMSKLFESSDRLVANMVSKHAINNSTSKFSLTELNKILVKWLAMLRIFSLKFSGKSFNSTATMLLWKMRLPLCRPSCSTYKSTTKKILRTCFLTLLIEISRKRGRKSAINKRNKNKGLNQPTKYKSIGASPL
jgi:hypothetical protein